mgnify:FL=1
MTFLFVSLAGGVGCVFRFALSTVIERYNRLGVPIATSVINVVGAFLLGLLTSITADFAGMGDLKVILGVGLLGGFTTFSAASAEAAEFVLGKKSQRSSARRFSWQPLKGVGLAAGTLVLAVGAGAFGLAIG